MITSKTVEDRLNMVERKLDTVSKNLATGTSTQLWKTRDGRILDASDTSRFVFRTYDNARVNIYVDLVIRYANPSVTLFINNCDYSMAGYLSGDLFMCNYCISVTLKNNINVALVRINNCEGTKLVDMRFKVEGTNLADSPTLVGCSSDVWVECHVNELRLMKSNDVIISYDSPVQELTCFNVGGDVYALVRTNNNLSCCNLTNGNTVQLLGSVTSFAVAKGMEHPLLYAVVKNSVYCATATADMTGCVFNPIELQLGKVDKVVCSAVMDGQCLVAFHTAGGYRVYMYDGEYTYCGTTNIDLMGIRQRSTDNILYGKFNGEVTRYHCNDQLKITQKSIAGHWDNLDIDENGLLMYSVGRDVFRTY